MSSKKTTVKSLTAWVTTVIAVLVLVVLTVQAFDPLPRLKDQAAIAQTTQSETAPAPVEHPHGLADYYTPVEPVVSSIDLAPGEVKYCPLDELSRAQCAYASLTPSLRQQAQERGRQDITVDPAGWPVSNQKVLIPALETVEGSVDYSGWLWNRSHLLADSLGGDAIRENLVAGTRTQNVGSTQTNGQADGGMAHLERLAREYLDGQSDDSCPLTYTAVANYTGDELVPRTVTVTALSCDGSFDESVEVSNTANGWSIDYADGSYEKD